MELSLFDIINNLKITGWAVVLAGLLSGVLPAIVFWQDTKKRNSKFLFFLGTIVFFWGFFYAFFEGSAGTFTAHLATVALYMYASLVPLFIFLFLYVFSVENNRISPLRMFLFFVPYFFIAALLYIHPSYIVSYQIITDSVSGKMVFGEGFWIFSVYIVGYIAIGIAFVANKYKSGAGIFKTAIWEILVASLISCATAILMSLLSPLFVSGAHDLFWIGHIFISLLIIASSFILIKYEFLNIRVIIAEFFISVVILVIIFELFFASSPIDLLIKSSITMIIILASSFLIGSIKREIKSKETITNLLNDLNSVSKRLVSLDRKKTEFLSIASHHLRDPLTSIKGYASLLIDGSFGELPKPVKEALEKIYVSSTHLITIVSDFMDVARIESGDIRYAFSDVDMKKLVLDTTAEMKRGAEFMSVIISVTIDDAPSEDESFITVGDAGKLRQVISNLIDNAIKYTPKGEVSILLFKSKDKRKIILSFSDTGIGMSKVTIEKLFKRFSRAEGVSKVYTEGTGLGLYVAREIIKKHEGRIWADSKGEGHGSTFYVELDAKV